MRIRTYSELSRLETIEDRYKYLKLSGEVAEQTFGLERYINQRFYRSTQWKQIRNHIIVRDNGCDLGVDGYEVYGQLTIHHMNPMTVADIRDGNSAILDPEYLIAVAHQTHNAIHYGDERQLPRPPVSRRAGDTKLW